jgi:hypothetical protein
MASKKYTVTFTYRGFVVAVIHNESENEKSAIESAKLYVSGRWTKVRAELTAELEGGAQ